jgi:hypothetical protein
VNIRKGFLILTSVGLIPIALSYGLAPRLSLEYLYGFTLQSLNEVHIFRAVMGLYLALIAFWLMGAFQTHLRQAALYSLVVFMLGLAAGRLLSFVVDGVPHWLLVFYFFAEVVSGVLGLQLLKRADE